MNMLSYCRFQNTLNDLRDCQENMDEGELSDDEKRARTLLLKVCAEITEDFAYLRPTRACTACNGSGVYDATDSPPCGACDGSGVEYAR